MHRALLTIFLGALTFFSCNKDSEPPSGEGEITFFLQGEFDNVALTIEAGKGDQYLFTDFGPNENSTLEYVGILGKNSCSTPIECPESFSISIKDISQNTPNFLETLDQVDLDFTGIADSAVTGYSVSFTQSSLNPIVTNYDMSNMYGAKSGGSFSQIYSINDAPFDDVCFSSGGLCSTSLCYPITITGDCHVTFDYSINTPLVSFTPYPSGTPPFSYEWDLGDGNGFIPSANPPAFNFNPTEGSRKICVRVTDNEGCVATHCKQVVLDSAYANCVVNFDYTAEALYTKDSLQLGTVLIQYTDENGKVYSSQKFNQPKESYFTILDHMEYKNNNASQATRKVNLQFFCTLYGDNFFDTKLVVVSDGVFAFAYSAE